MTRTELVARVWKNARNKGVYIDQHRVGQIVDVCLDTIVDTVAQGEDVKILGFGKFESVEKKRTTFVNPITKEKIMQGKYLQPKFTPGKTFKEKVYKEV